MALTNESRIIRQVSIREAGQDEAWLHDHVIEDPSCLDLGGENIEVIATERRQASGGRLDLLLKDDEDTMYEVELMLGETDESHIIRTIEYWDTEKRKWPLREHYAVLVAEHINRRFFNVIQLFSHSIPIIAIKVALLDTGGLFFTKVLDTYEEIEDGGSLEDKLPLKREDWLKKAKWTVDTADALLGSLHDVLVSPTLNYRQSYVAVNAMGQNVFALNKRSGNKSVLRFRVPQALASQVKDLLDASNVPYRVKQLRKFHLTIDQPMVDSHKEMFRKIAALESVLT